MNGLISYDNEKDLRLMAEDFAEFITSETNRIVELNFKGTDDPNVYVLVSQNITFMIMQILVKAHVNNDVFVSRFKISEENKQGGNHLPINGPDFFKGMIP